MTITIELPETAAKRLTDKAAKAGKTLKGYVWEIAVREANGPDGKEAPADGASLMEATRQARSPEARAAHLMHWLDGHDLRAPALPAAAVSREAMYGEEREYDAEGEA